MRTWWWIVFAAAAALSAPRGFAGEPHRVVDAACGVSVVLPDASWTLHDQSTGALLLHLYSPSPGLVPRFGAVRQPKSVAPGGLDRARVVSRLAGTRVDPTDVKLAGAPAQRIEYVVKGVRSVEIGLVRGDDFLFVQVVAPEERWADAAGGAELKAIIDSLSFVATAAPQARTDLTPPAQVRAARAAAARPRPFAIRRHDVRVRVDPATHRLECRDAFDAEALDEAVLELRLRSSGVVVDSVRRGASRLAVERIDEASIRVHLPEPLRRGATVRLECAAHADDYFLAVDQKLLTEIALLGQVRPESSYSSHAIYFPVDRENDAAVDLEITVPEPYVAVSGGVVAARDAPGRGLRAFAWSFDGRPRILPPGFAVAAYASKSAKTAGGVRVEVYGLPDAGTRVDAQLARALRAASLFEETMGPLPWGRVAVCQVRPERKGIAVSLPGLVLLSDGYFGADPTAPVDGATFVAGGASDVMGVVDELAHQWNGYTADYPNELAEGLSTFACLLFIERESGVGEYRMGVRACATHYVETSDRGEDVALANPALYRSSAYRMVAFAKVAVVLDLLRRHLGDPAFFAGWRRAFASAPAGRGQDYDDFRRAFETASGADLAGFFEQWFFRAGHPRVRVTWDSVTGARGAGVRVRAEQTQPGPPFEVDVPVEIRTAAGAVVVRDLALRTRDDAVEIELPDAPAAVVLDPRGDVPLVRAVGR